MARKTAKQMREEEEQLLASLSKSENKPNTEEAEPALFSKCEKNEECFLRRNKRLLSKKWYW